MEVFFTGIYGQVKLCHAEMHFHYQFNHAEPQPK